MAAVFALGALVPMRGFAELSNDPMLGLGLRSRPAYDGSRAQRTEPVPVVRYFGEPWFARSTQGVLEGGVRMELVPGLHVGSQLAYEPGRPTSDSEFLEAHRVGTIQRGASAGLQAEWDHKFGPVPITLLARGRQSTDTDLGAQADLRLSVGAFQSGPFAAGLFTQATWASGKSADTLYGVTPQQATVTGLPVFNAGSGWLFVSFGLLWSADLSPNWVAVGNLEMRRLHGDAARSPLAERASNHYATVGVAYRY